MTDKPCPRRAAPAPTSEGEREVIEDVAAERHRQKKDEGWTEAHDDSHTDGSLATAAACYALATTEERPERAAMEEFGASGTPDRLLCQWPWARKWWKPKSKRRDLVRAAALLIAEIERLDRLAARAAKDEAPETDGAAPHGISAPSGATASVAPKVGDRSDTPAPAPASEGERHFYYGVEAVDFCTNTDEAGELCTLPRNHPVHGDPVRERHEFVPSYFAEGEDTDKCIFAIKHTGPRAVMCALPRNHPVHTGGADE